VEGSQPFPATKFQARIAGEELSVMMRTTCNALRAAGASLALAMLLSTRANADLLSLDCATGTVHIFVVADLEKSTVDVHRPDAAIMDGIFPAQISAVGITWRNDTNAPIIYTYSIDRTSGDLAYRIQEPGVSDAGPYHLQCVKAEAPPVKF
jgi:hypothetical protein